MSLSYFVVTNNKQFIYIQQILVEEQIEKILLQGNKKGKGERFYSVVGIRKIAFAHFLNFYVIFVIISLMLFVLIFEGKNLVIVY